MTTGPTPMRVGILGVTHPHLSARVRSFRELGAQFVSAWDSGPELPLFCNALGVDLASDERGVLNDPSIDAVLVHSKSERMVPLTVNALQAGKHVLVEKPGGTGVQDLTQLVSASENSDRVCQVGYNFRFSPALDFARDCERHGVLGRITHVRAHGASSRDEHLSAHLNQPADMGGALWVIGCHVVELLVSLFGAPGLVSAEIRKFPDWSPAGSREDGAVGSFDYGHLLAAFDFTVNDYLEWFETSEVTLNGQYGQLTFGVLPARWSLYLTEARGGLSAGWTHWRDSYFTTPWTGEPAAFTELPQVGNRRFFDQEAAAFIGATAGEKVDIPTAADALAVAAVIDGMYRSSSQNGLHQQIPATATTAVTSPK